jgi:hypothetical protein
VTAEISAAISEAALEIAVDRYRDALGDRPEVGQGLGQ